MDQQVEYELLRRLDQLSADKRKRVVDFARRLASEEGPGESRGLLRFAGSIPPDDLAVMAKVIEEGCEQPHPDEW